MKPVSMTCQNLEMNMCQAYVAVYILTGLVDRVLMGKKI